MCLSEKPSQDLIPQLISPDFLTFAALLRFFRLVGIRVFLWLRFVLSWTMYNPQEGTSSRLA
ncbi:MAG: hypothetical protein CMA84_01130 [Euryarchaeota archaeon]|nr:hypothetical protein [Euryarchaeota archaeon]